MILRCDAKIMWIFYKTLSYNVADTLQLQRWFYVGRVLTVVRSFNIHQMRAKHFHVRLWVNTSRWYVVFQLCPESRETWRTVAIFDGGNITRRTMARTGVTFRNACSFLQLWWWYFASSTARKINTIDEPAHVEICQVRSIQSQLSPNSQLRNKFICQMGKESHLRVAGASPSILFIHRHNKILWKCR